MADEDVKLGVKQYVLLGAGLDTFAQRRPEVASRITIFEVDSPGHSPGNNTGWPNWASACPTRSGSSPSTSRPTRGGIDCWPFTTEELLVATT